MNTFAKSRSNSGLWFRIFAVTACATLLAVPAVAQLHVQPSAQPAADPSAATPVQMPTQAIAAKYIETHGWPSQQTIDLVSLRGASSPAEKKLSFNLLLIARKTRKASATPVDSMLDATALNSDGTVTVEIDAFLSPSLMASPVMLKVVEANGGSIPVLAYESDRLLVKVRPAQLLDIAANPNVVSIRQSGATTQAINIEPAKPAAR